MVVDSAEEEVAVVGVGITDSPGGMRWGIGTLHYICTIVMVFWNVTVRSERHGAESVSMHETRSSVGYAEAGRETG